MTAFTTQDIKKLGTILGVWAHPDDETFCMAGIMMAAVANGQHVACITATRGEKGSQNPQRWPLETLGKVREQEMEAALKVIGCKHHEWLDYIDGELPQVDTDEAVGKIARIISQVRPDSIFSFGPDGATGHPDHITVSHWTQLAADTAGSTATIYRNVDSREWYERSGYELDKKINIYFNTDQPPLIAEADMDLLYKLPNYICRRKTNALRMQTSQTEIMFNSIDPAVVHDLVCTEGFMIARRGHSTP